VIVAPFDGLRAGESRAVPLDVVVVGHLEKLPTAMRPLGQKTRCTLLRRTLTDRSDIPATLARVQS